MPWGRFLLLMVCLLWGCGRALPSATQSLAPVASAAQPAVSGKGDLAYAWRGAEAMRSALRDVDPEEALQRISGKGFYLPDAQVSARCAAAPGEYPALVCHFGPPESPPIAQAILWHEREAWRSQLYPQAPPGLADERRGALTDLACQIGCHSGISQARQTHGETGPELLVVVDLGIARGHKAEEVQVLRMVDGLWEVLWVPGDGNWNHGHAEVVLASRGIAQFEMRSSSWIRRDRLHGYLDEPLEGEHRRFSERWVRKGDGFVMRDQWEEPTPYGALVRLIHYLSTGADEKARLLIRPEISLDEARKALAQNPPRQGWKLTRFGDNGFQLDTAKKGKPTLGVRFERQDAGWVLSEIARQF